MVIIKKKELRSMVIISSLFIQRWPSSRFLYNTYFNNDCTVYFKFIFNFLISSQLCRTIHHCLLIEPSPICAFIDVLLSVEKPYILGHFQALHSIEINVASQNNDKIRIWIVLFCVISSEPAQHFMLNSRLPPDKPVTKSGHVVTESGPRLEVTESGFRR